MTHSPTAHPHTTRTSLFVAALGVVFGDIGTSPLYTLRECFHAAGLAITPTNIYGILAAIAWSLILVVTIKYVAIVMRADNRGEGGILALTALAIDQFASSGHRWRILLLGLMGAALFYGDAVITPAMSVLSAMEGLELIAPSLHPLILPGALAIIIGLFAIQRYGTETMGKFFGPIMLVWFSVLALLGINQIILNPGVLQALNPVYALYLAVESPALAFLTMGAVVLAVTGGEALYADMGHLGRKPIQYAWLLLVGPALLLNYFGQGALLLADPTALENPFYLLTPQPLLIPMVILATLATIIASQAVISGAFSLTHQAIQMGYLPRMQVIYTNLHNAGQIYIPVLNMLMMLCVLLLILGFRNSSNLAAAYGIAVTGTMMLTTFLATTVLHNRNRWNVFWAGLFTGTFFTLDALYFTANMHKIPHGGWFPLVLGLGLLFIMHTWVVGRKASRSIVQQHTPPLESFISSLAPTLPLAPRTGVFLTSDLNHAPPALIYNINHNAVLHNQIIVLKIARARIPRYPASERYSVRHLPHGVTTVLATFGFLERPNVPHMLSHELPHHGLTIRHPKDISYFLSTHTYIPSPSPVLNPFQESLFILLDKIAQSAVVYFRLPRKQVIEIGNQIEI